MRNREKVEEEGIPFEKRVVEKRNLFDLERYEDEEGKKLRLSFKE